MLLCKHASRLLIRQECLSRDDNDIDASQSITESHKLGGGGRFPMTSHQKHK